MIRRTLFVPVLKATLLILATAAGLAACQSEDVGTAQDALTAVQGSQQTCAALGAGVHECLGQLATCVKGAADASAADACKTAFAGCLPVDPPRHGGGDGHHGPPHGGPGGPPPGGHHGGHHGGDMAGGCPGMGGEDACNPSAQVLDGCKANLDACIAAGAAPSGCIATADECVANAIQDRFKALCDMQASAVCDQSGADADTCAALDQACSDGVSLPAKITVRAAIPITKE